MSLLTPSASKTTEFVRCGVGVLFLVVLFVKFPVLLTLGVTGLGIFLLLLAFGGVYTLAHLVFAFLAGGEQSARFEASSEDRLDELERLKRRDMVTPEEYAAKRQDILKDL